jgi:hypothetical protein
VLLASGEKSRLIELRAAAPAPAATVARPAPDATPVDRASSSAAIGPWLLGGTSLVALGSFTYFALSAKKRLNHLQATCSPACSPAETAAGKREAVVADVSLGVSVVALAGAVTWALLASSTSEQQARATPLSLVASPHGGFATLSGAF